MNTIKSTLLLLAITLYSVAALDGAVGCMDNSQHLRQGFDTKAYHYVHCDCVCRSHGPGSNRCAKCGHLMVPQTEEYVTSADADYTNRGNLSQYMQDPAKKLQLMIKKYRAPSRASGQVKQRRTN